MRGPQQPRNVTFTRGAGRSMGGLPSGSLPACAEGYKAVDTSLALKVIPDTRHG
jgi:hypothetical protein